MLVLYFFQGEPGESLDVPNGFMIPQDGNINFGQFLKYLPQSIHQTSNAHYRFRMEDSLSGYVWVDIKDPSETLPVFEGVITAKILRTSPIAEQRRHLHLKKKAQVDGFFKKENDTIRAQFGQNSAPSSSSSAARPPVVTATKPPPVANNPPSISTNTTSQSPQPNSPQTPSTNPLQQSTASSKIGPPPAANPAPSSKPVPTPAPAPAPVTNLLDDDDIHSGFSQSPTPAAQTAAPNIFGDDDFGTAAPTTSSKKVASSVSTKASTSGLDDIDEHPSSKSQGNPNNLSREELAAQKSEVIEDKVRSALEFKKELDNKAQREMDDFDAAREKHEKALLAWATNNKEKRNVRTLLTTMHTVLPPGNKWKAIGLGDVLEPSQVKKQYRKAMLVVHPDHTIGADSEAKFICKRVFEAINEAYDEFLKKESV